MKYNDTSRPSGQKMFRSVGFFCGERRFFMKEMELKYGCNPNQKPARIYMKNGELPITVLNGKPGYINLLDASTAGS